MPPDPALVRLRPVSAEPARDVAAAMMHLEQPPSAFIFPREIASPGLLTGLRDPGVALSGREIASRDGTCPTRFP